MPHSESQPIEPLQAPTTKSVTDSSDSASHRTDTERTILGKLGGSIDKSGQLYYTVATWIRSNQSDGSYTIFHDGISRYYWGATPEFMYTESTFPGYAWVIAMVPEPSLSERRSILEETRNILRETVDEHQF